VNVLFLVSIVDTLKYIDEMMEYACVETARPGKHTHKAVVIDWDDVYKADPDVIVVGCCGFDLERNVRDTLDKKERLQKLRAGQNHRIYAAHGDWYIAQPAPFLLQGVALLAQCAYQNEQNVLDAIAELGYESLGWQAVDIMTNHTDSLTNGKRNEKINTSLLVEESMIADMEDLFPDKEGFSQAHDLACEQGELSYIDPETGYNVFTEIAHKKRGKCCGSGCRHCPYSHKNVKNKAAKIQQPSILYQQETRDGDQQSQIFSINNNKDIKVLFFSGGKDSFLAIRALVRGYYEIGPFGLVLMTTFDAATRVIAHQEVNIDQVIKQASHLNITLVGIPLRKGSGETYTNRIRSGLEVIKSFLPSQSRISSLVFGDLHLSPVKEWRDKILTQLDYELEYPIWKISYSDLIKDLEASKVPCQVSGSTREKEVPLGTMFDRKLYERLLSSDIDPFGECGEFHSLAMVWDVSRTTALGLR
ncbi:MAG: diphthamide synthase (EF-2-diphthine--ammonia ligase), partial [Bacillariaceae sp.]|jgi:ATP-binding cassette subfamily B (MDR/TAP) protein 1